MENNQFAAFSYSGPPRKTPLRGRPSKFAGKKGGSTSLPGAHPWSLESHEAEAARGGGKVELENVPDYGTCALDSRSGMGLPEGGPNPKSVPGIRASEEHFLPVAKAEKAEAVVEEEEQRRALLPVVGAIQVKAAVGSIQVKEALGSIQVKEEVGAIQVKDKVGAIQVKEEVCAIQIKEETKENVDSVPLNSDFPPSVVKKRSLSARRSGTGKDLNQDIEDSVGGLSCRTSDWDEHDDTKISIKRQNKKAGKPGLSEVGIPPIDWNKALQNIRIMRTGRDAPVDLLGPEQLVDTTADLDTQKFHVLVAAMISSQTRDSVTAAAMKRLQTLPGGLTVQNLAESDISLETLEELLKPVLYYRQKSKHLKGMAEILLRPPYCGSVPRTLDELMKLPGVGPKVGLLVLWVGFGMGEVGLIVDTNVRRVSCRLGWAPEGSTAGKVREALESWLPKNLWAEISFLFVGFGQQICKPIGPKCEECGLNSFCPSAFKCVKKVTSKKV